MPPKKVEKGPSKKVADKAKAKVIEDKTFGLKNKNKSKKVEKFIKGVHQQVKGTTKKAETDKFLEKQQKEDLKEKEKMEASLFKSCNTTS